MFLAIEIICSNTTFLRIETLHKCVRTSNISVICGHDDERRPMAHSSTATAPEIRPGMSQISMLFLVRLGVSTYMP
jgi:hypothetical protein